MYPPISGRAPVDRSESKLVSFLITRLFSVAGITLLMGSFSLLGAETSVPVALHNSIRQVEAAPQTGPLNPHRAFITRRSLKASEAGEMMEFEVALKMRNFAELQARELLVAMSKHDGVDTRDFGCDLAHHILFRLAIQT